MSSPLNVVIVGNGVAGITAAQTIKDKNPETHVSIYTDETMHYYPRPRLYDVLSDEAKPQDIVMFTEEWYNKKGIKVKLDKKAIYIDTEQKKLFFEDQSTVNYDKLLLANGGHCFVPPVAGVEKTGVFTVRKVKDVLAIKKFAKKTKKTIIVGGGLLGLEFASSLNKLGQQVTVIELLPWLLPKQLDNDGASILKNHLTSQGINIIVNTKTHEILGDSKVSGVLLEGGEKIQGELVLISAGIRSNIELAKKSGIKVNRGVIIDKYLQTSTNDVYAAGDVVEFEGKVYGIIPAAINQATIAANNILNEKKITYTGTIPSNTLKVVNIDLTSIGIINPTDPKYEEIKEVDKEKGTYKKLVLDNGKIVGAILLGDKRQIMSIKKLIAQEKDIRQYKHTIFKKDFDFKTITS